MSRASFGSAFGEAMRELGYGARLPPERELSRQEVSELAMQRAGTRNKSSRAYLSARRSIERRRTTTAAQTRGQPERRFTRRMRRDGLRVVAQVEIDPSPKAGEGEDESDMRERTIELQLSGDALELVADALDRGDVAEAAEGFLDALLRAYEQESGDPDLEAPSFLAGAEVGDVGGLDIGWGDGDDF